MVTNDKGERPLILYQVAFLASEGMTQKEIASVLNVSQSTVSTMLVKASATGKNNRALLDPRPRFIGNPEERAMAENSLYLGDLQEKLKVLAGMLGWHHVPQVHIGVTEAGKGNWDEQVLSWGRSIAPVIADLLLPCSVISISWGRQLRAVVDNLPAQQRKLHSIVCPIWPPRLSVVPEKGDSQFLDHIVLGSNSLARDLSAHLNGPLNALESAEYFLPGIDLLPFGDPPFDLGPKPYSKKIKAALKKEQLFIENYRTMLRQIPSYAKIFGTKRERDPKCLIRKSDAMLLSIGPAGTHRSFDVGNNYGGVSRDWLSKNSAGDVGGVLLPLINHSLMRRSGGRENDAGQDLIAEQFERLRLHWTGVEEGDVKHCADHGKVGTIVCGVGKERAGVALVASCRQLLRHLCCDRSLAEELNKLIDELIIILKSKGKA